VDLRLGCLALDLVLAALVLSLKHVVEVAGSVMAQLAAGEWSRCVTHLLHRELVEVKYSVVAGC